VVVSGGCVVLWLSEGSFEVFALMTQLGNPSSPSLVVFFARKGKDLRGDTSECARHIRVMGQYHMGKAAASTSAEASASVATPRSHEGVGGEKTTEPSESNKKVKKNNSSDDEEKETPSNNDVLLTRLLTELPEVFEKEFLPLLHPNDLAMLMRVGHDARKVVVASGLPRAGATAELPLMVVGFCQSVEVLAWGKYNECPWNEMTFAFCCLVGGMEVVLWARERGIPWDADAISFAAAAGRLDVLQYLRAGGCPWHEGCIQNAALNDQLELLAWLKVGLYKLNPVDPYLESTWFPLEPSM
jgi:hypothetical protein